MDTLLKKLEIKHYKIRPRTPEHNGKVERSHRNDNERFYSYLKFYSIFNTKGEKSRTRINSSIKFKLTKMYKIYFIYFCKYWCVSTNKKFNDTTNFFIKVCFTSLTHIHN